MHRQHCLPPAGPIIGSTSMSFPRQPATWVSIDSDLSMETHVKRTASRCFSTLRQLRSIRRQEDKYRPLSSSRWSLLSCSAGSTTVTSCWLGYLPTWSGVCPKRSSTA